jgi:Domain of unknown function (DUF4279)
VPEEITRRVGLQPDRAILRGSRVRDPSRPRRHMWQIRCEERGVRVDDQIASVLARLEPARDAIRALTTGPDDVSARLQVVRELNADDGEEDVVIEADGQIEDLSKQHRLLGWHVERSVLEFLNEVRADLDVDEYG